MHLREAICIALGDSCHSRPRNRIEMRYIEQACRQGQNPFENLTKEKFQERKKVIQLHEAVLNVSKRPVQWSLDGPLSPAIKLTHSGNQIYLPMSSKRSRHITTDRNEEKAKY